LFYFFSVSMPALLSLFPARQSLIIHSERVIYNTWGEGPVPTELFSNTSRCQVVCLDSRQDQGQAVMGRGGSLRIRSEVREITIMRNKTYTLRLECIEHWRQNVKE
jgi:hypothetical protein